MKSLADLHALRDKLKADIKLRQSSGTKIIVGMGTCGIAAGAREVMSAILQELNKRHLFDVQVQQTGCIGMCEKEVLVDVASGRSTHYLWQGNSGGCAKNYRRACGKRSYCGRACRRQAGSGISRMHGTQLLEKLMYRSL